MTDHNPIVYRAIDLPEYHPFDADKGTLIFGQRLADVVNSDQIRSETQAIINRIATGYRKNPEDLSVFVMPLTNELGKVRLELHFKGLLKPRVPMTFACPRK